MSNSNNANNAGTAAAAVTVEQAFVLIHDGNEAEDKSELWSASDSFCRAYEILERLMTSQATTTASSDGARQQQQSENEKEEETKQICRLYQEKSIEYRHRARLCFVRALEQEAATSKSATEEDEEASISDEEALSRLDLFAHLFSKPHLLPQQQQQDISEQQTSLEERLSQLNDALPQGFKTSDERMRDINRGLNRLGLQLYSNSDEDNKDSNSANRLLMSANLNSHKSEIEQVDDIIDQAKAEVAMINATTTDEAKAAATSSLSRRTSSSLHYSADSSSTSLDTDDVASYFESMLAGEPNNVNDSVNQDDNSNEDDNNGIALETIDSIRDHVADAQTSLAELMVLLAGAEAQNDDNDDSVVLVDRDSARELLKQAGVKLVKATKELLGAANKS